MIDHKPVSRRRLAIALFIPDLGMGGAERVFVTVANYFVARGAQVEMVLANKSGPLLNEVDPRVNIVDLASLRPGEPAWLSAIKTLFSLTRYMRSSTPSAMLTTLTGANLVAIVARLFSKSSCRLVVREAASLANVKSGLRLRLMRHLYPLSDKIVVLTEFMKGEMVASLGLPEERIAVIGNPVDCVKIQALAAESASSQMISELSPYAVVIGRLTEPKDCGTVIRAVALVNDKSPVNLVIIGEGPLREELESLSRALGVGERVFLLGDQSNPYPWLKQADLFILSSKWEGYPNVLLEAMCLMKPIVATEYDSSLRGILSAYPKQLFHIVAVGNDAEMAGAIVKILGNYDSIEDEMDFSINKTMGRYLQVLEDIEKPQDQDGQEGGASV